MEVRIAAEHLSFHYTDEENKAASPEILKDLSLTLEPGTFAAVLGHNGCGKSTLAKHMNGILLPTGGKMWVAGMDTADETKLYEIRQRVGMVFQNPDNQIVATIVEEDAAFGPENLGLPPEEIRRRVDDALKAVGMYDYRMHAPSQLSGGQKQRVAIAGIIAMRPSCIVLDEPTAMLDPKGRREVMKTIRLLNSLGQQRVNAGVGLARALDFDRLQDQPVVVFLGSPDVRELEPRNRSPSRFSAR